jgi:uncharacterized protein
VDARLELALMKFWRLVAFFLLFADPATAAELQQLDIQTAQGKLTFNVELAQMEAEREYGLMNRPSLPQDSGMLFLFVPEQKVAFWMKNTLIPLDMLFITKDGVIRGIAKQAKPLSLDNIWSPQPISAVLEINGGRADQLGIVVGDKVSAEALKTLN